MRDHRRRRAQHVGERAHVARERVDERDAVRPRDLHQAELRPVGALAEELGVEPVRGLVEEHAHEIGQRAVVRDPAHLAPHVVGRRGIAGE